MEETARILTLTVHVWKDGKEIDVKWVLYVTYFYVLIKHPFFIAICNETFCMNGGNCSHPNTNCTCMEGWEGNRCEMGIICYLFLCSHQTYHFYSNMQ